MAKITINLKALETMLFIWASLRDREKISDPMIVELAKSPEMKAAYQDDFTVESVRKVLSAISNREMMNAPTKKESRFWNYNMWMLEDAEMTDMMLAPIKLLNLDQLVNEMEFTSDVEVVFYPGHFDIATQIDNALYINFFTLKVDIYGDEPVKIENVEIAEYIHNKISL